MKDFYKIIVLIIDSDVPHTENYSHCREIWRKYMNINSEIKCFFIKCKNYIQEEYIIDETNNYIYCKGEECLIPGILNKTIISMKAVLEKYEFDYIIRTNLSSFWNFNVLLKYIETLPKTLCANAFIGEKDGVEFLSGAGFILSKDLTQLMIENENNIQNKDKELDDVVIGAFLKEKNIKFTSSKRFDVISSIDYKNFNPKINEIHHYRVLYDRYVQDKFIRNKLFELIYS